MKIKTKKPNKKSAVYFVLDGKVAIEERVGSKVIDRAEIDGETVLQILLGAMKNGMKIMEEEHKEKNKC